MVDEVGLEALEGLWLVGCCVKTMALIGRGHALGKGRQQGTFQVRVMYG